MPLLESGIELEPIVIGVIDGIEPCEAPRRAVPSAELKVDQAFAWSRRTARASRAPTAPSCVCSTPAHRSMPGKLRIQATDIELLARRGSVDIQADYHVVVQGEVLRLN